MVAANCDDDDVGSTKADARLLRPAVCKIMPLPMVDIRMRVLMIREERDLKFSVVDDDDVLTKGW